MSACVRNDLLKRQTWMAGIEWYRHDLDYFSSLASFCFQRSNVVKTNVFVSRRAPTHPGCLSCPPRVWSSTRAKVEHWGELSKLVTVVHYPNISQLTSCFRIRHRKGLTFVRIQPCCCCSRHTNSRGAKSANCKIWIEIHTVENKPLHQNDYQLDTLSRLNVSNRSCAELRSPAWKQKVGRIFLIFPRHDGLPK